MNKPILLTFGTHGNEYRLKKCLEYIPEHYFRFFDTLDVNEEAIRKNKRFVHFDMNRTAPGDILSDEYELRRGAEIHAIMQNYRVVIDIHGTDSDTGSFVLLPRASANHIVLASVFQSENIILWQSGLGKSWGPIVQFHPLALEIETGPINETMLRTLAENIIHFLDMASQKYDLWEYLERLKNRNIFLVVARLDRKKAVSIPNRDFERVEIEGEEYFTLLTDNPYPETRCYLMKKKELSELFLSPLPDFSSPVTDIF